MSRVNIILHTGLPENCRQLADKFREIADIIAIELLVETVLERGIQCFDPDDWLTASSFPGLNRQFIEKYREKLSFGEICKCNIRLEMLIKHFPDDMQWYVVSYNQHITWDFIRTYQNKFNNWTDLIESYRPDLQQIADINVPAAWPAITQNCTFSPQDIVRFADRLHWKYLLCKDDVKLPPNAAELYKGEIDPYWGWQITSPDVFRQFADKLDFSLVSASAKIPGDILEKHYKEIQTDILHMIDLPAKFIRKHRNELDFTLLAQHQDPSKIFPRFADRIDWTSPDLPEYTLEKLAMYVDWVAVTRSRSLSIGFINRNANRLDIDYLINIRGYKIVSAYVRSSHDTFFANDVYNFDFGTDTDTDTSNDDDVSDSDIGDESENPWEILRHHPETCL